MRRRLLFGLCAWMAISLSATAQPRDGELRSGRPPLPSELVVLAASTETIRVDGALHRVSVARVEQGPELVRAALARSCGAELVARDGAASCIGPEGVPSTVFFVRGESAPATVIVVEIEQAIPLAEEGLDAPGIDLPDVPRPVRSLRRASARAAGGESTASSPSSSA